MAEFNNDQLEKLTKPVISLETQCAVGMERWKEWKKLRDDFDAYVWKNTTIKLEPKSEFTEGPYYCKIIFKDGFISGYLPMKNHEV